MNKNAKYVIGTILISLVVVVVYDAAKSKYKASKTALPVATKTAA